MTVLVTFFQQIWVHPITYRSPQRILLLRQYAPRLRCRHHCPDQRRYLRPVDDRQKNPQRVAQVRGYARSGHHVGGTRHQRRRL